MKLGYIGYGEAAHAMASGLREEGFTNQYCWSLEYVYQPEDDGVERLESEEKLFEVCDVIFAIVPAFASIAVATAAKPFMTPRHIYADMSSAAPRLMMEVWNLIRDTGVQFVDGAMLDTLPKYRHKVPTVVSGIGAKRLMELAKENKLGMNLDFVAGDPGSASAIKVLRSLYTKAHLALSYEMLEAASHYGVEEYVMNSLAQTMDDKDFISGMDGRTCGGLLHAGRRAEELEAAAEMLEDAGLNAPVSRAGAEKLKEVGGMDLRKKLGDYRPKTWKEAIDAINKYRL